MKRLLPGLAGQAGSLHTCTAKVEKQEDTAVARYKLQRKTRSTLEGCGWSGGQAQLTMFIPYLYMRTKCISVTPGGKGWGQSFPGQLLSPSESLLA